MLYDPKWEQKTETKEKPSAISVAGLAAWLETQNPRTTYSYTDVCGCLISRYLKAQGYRGAYCGPKTFHYTALFIFPINRDLPRAMNDIAARGPYTFGSALERARSALAGVD